MLDKNTVKERKRMELVIKRFGELSAQELYAILQARVDVFVVEQKYHALTRRSTGGTTGPTMCT